MRLLNTVDAGEAAFVRRAQYEIAHAYPKPKASGRTGAGGYLKWFWPSHGLTLVVWVGTGRAALHHAKLRSGAFWVSCVRNSREVYQLFYCMFDLLGNDDQAFRILTEPYKGP